MPRKLAEAGAYRVLDVLGESVLLVRNREGKLRAFYNVCRHRGSRLCRSAAAGAPSLRGGISGGRITCPYHQWTYDLDGRLLAAPHLSGEPGFDKSLFSLHPVGLECWGGFVFLNLTPAAAVPLPRAARRDPGAHQPLPAGAAAHRAHHPLRGGGELEGDLRELQ